MRVIAGKAKGRKLKAVPGDSTRPITDRVKENLFNILGDWVIETRWLDLFAGTGQVGIEALSRGAEHVVFVDKNRSAVKVVRHNLELTRLAGDAQVLNIDAFQYLRTGPRDRFDVIYVAPPQYHGMWIQVLALIEDEPSSYLSPDGMVIIQIDPKEFENINQRNLTLFDQRRYGNTMLCFYEGSTPTSKAITH